MDFNQAMPIYLQLMDDIKRQIISGQLSPGEKMASVRDLAMQYAVNPNTMQKALGELERENLLFSQRTSGRFVTIDEETIATLRKDMAGAQVAAFIGVLRGMGYDDEQIMALIKNFLEGKEDGNTTVGV